MAKKILLDKPFDVDAPNAVSELSRQLGIQQEILRNVMKSIADTQSEITMVQRNCKHEYGFTMRTNWTDIYRCVHCSRYYHDNDDLQTRITRRP